MGMDPFNFADALLGIMAQRLARRLCKCKVAQPATPEEIQSLIEQMREKNLGILITDHNVRETLGLTDRAYIIYSGEVLTEGNTSDIVSNPEVRRLYLGADFRL